MALFENYASLPPIGGAGESPFRRNGGGKGLPEPRKAG